MIKITLKSYHICSLIFFSLWLRTFVLKSTANVGKYSSLNLFEPVQVNFDESDKKVLSIKPSIDIWLYSKFTWIVQNTNKMHFLGLINWRHSHENQPVNAATRLVLPTLASPKTTTLKRWSCLILLVVFSVVVFIVVFSWSSMIFFFKGSYYQ